MPKLIKKISLLTGSIVALTLSFNGAPASAIPIDNDIAEGTLGHWSVDVMSGGESRDANITADRYEAGDVVTENVLFDYFTYVDVGAGGVQLSTGTPSLTGDDEVTSSGSFAGNGGNTINWTAVSSIADNSSVFETTYTFTASTGTLGDIRLLQYLDEDIEGVSDDIFFTRGTAAEGNFQLFTVDGPQLYGVSQSGAFSADQGLVNSSFAGWAANQYNLMKPAISAGTQNVSPTGVIENLGSINDPQVGPARGPADIVSVLAWDVSEDATTATIITSLGGVPDIEDIPVDPNPPQPIPEPMTIFGTTTALGLGALFKRKIAKKKQ